MAENKKKINGQVIIFIIVFAAAFFGTKFVMSGFSSTTNKLKKVALDLNKKAPMMLDAETRLDSSTAVEKTLEYHYTLVHIAKEDSTVNLEGAKQFVMKQAQGNFDSNPKMKDFRELHVTLKYDYKDKNGKSLFNFTITSQNKK